MRLNEHIRKLKGHVRICMGMGMFVDLCAKKKILKRRPHVFQRVCVMCARARAYACGGAVERVVVLCGE